jgi:hypothetical protein
MAQSVQIAPGGGLAKMRNPWGVIGLSLITLGIYYVFWWYFINREMRDFGNANNVDLGQSPGTSVLAITLGAFVIVPPFVSVWNTGRRMEGTQRTAGVSGGSGPLFFVLHIIPIVSLFAPVYMQTELNKAWHAIRELPTGQASELSTAPDADVGSLTVDTGEAQPSSAPSSDGFDEVEHPEPTPAQPRQEDAD